MDAYFIFNDIKSTDMGIEMKEYPDIEKPSRRMNTVTIDGKDGFYTQDLKAYDGITISIQCISDTLAEKNKNLNLIGQWLSGSGRLILSHEPDKYYDVIVSNSISIADIVWVFPEFKVDFKAQPFKKSVNEINDFLTITTNTKIYNKGTYTSLPIITIYGTGNTVLTINNRQYTLNGISEYVTINSEIQEVYKGEESQNSIYQSTEFPYLDVGYNDISFTGNITKIEINPKWRWF